MSKRPRKPQKKKGATTVVGAGGGAGRQLHTKVKSARGRKYSSTLWLQRQLNDPYVQAAQREGYRSRAAYKLIELDERYELLKPGMRVLDLGAAPGGWSQICAGMVRSQEGKGRVVAVDILEMEELAGVEVMTMDFMAADAPERIRQQLGGPVDAVISDMAAPTTGHKSTDHLRIMALCEAAVEFAYEVLAPDGMFLCKVFQGGTEDQLLADMRRNFKSVKHAKPKASRSDSAEQYVIATGFRGLEQG